MQALVWRAEGSWSARAAKADETIRVELPTAVATKEAGASPQLRFRTREIDGHTLVVRQEIRAEVPAGDGLGEVTFALERSSRPDVYEVLGTDDAPPYRVFWAPPDDWADGETATFIATYDDLRGAKISAATSAAKVFPATGHAEARQKT
jgi:hypothetical protein